MDGIGTSAPFRSFWMAGFEGADHRNGTGAALDMVRVTGHAAQLEADHARCARFGFGAVRESIGWRLAEPQPGHYDFTRLRRMARSARRHGLQVLWTLMHYGMPDDLHVLHPDFVPRFAAFARAAALELQASGETAPVVTPVNEIGFLAWVLSETRDMAGGPPGTEGHDQASSRRSGYEVKLRLAEAALAACRAMREVLPGVRFLHVEPVVHVVPPEGQPELAALADEVASYQWQVWDLLCGRLEPQLGGAPQCLDLLGLNHYHSGQWEVGTEKRLYWHLQDPRRQPFGELALAAWRRYGHPLIVAETSHVGVGRAQWFCEMAAEVERVRGLGVPLEGLCLYPVIDRPDWTDPDHWHNSGLWDAAPAGTGGPGGAPGRVLCQGYAKALRRWQRRMPSAHSFQHNQTQREQAMKSPLIVFSHLRWDFVYQRPQHLLSRVAHQHRVIFIEEPMYEAGTAPKFEYRNPCDNVLVLRPITDVQAPGFHDDQLKALKPLLQQLLHDEALEDYLVWFYTPMALPLLAELQPKAVIYDCMDELAAFKGAPRQMRQRESALLKTADLVLTGGPSLYQAKRELNAHVHCLPSSVDATHYAPERITLHSDEYLAAEQLQGHLIAPRLGYFGVIDERLDIGLIAALADANPQWHIVMVGPVAKIDRAALPQRPNIHWLGQQPYQRLPALVAGWDVCLLPFAINEHTRYISPTKTLEYLAAEKPVVSTPVNDVVGMYGDVVRIAKSHDAFIEACRDALDETPQQRAERLMASAATVSRFSWDELARAVLPLVEEAVERGRRPMAAAESTEAAGPFVEATSLPIAHTLAASDGSTTSAPRAVRELIIGAGPTGLAAAYHLGQAGNADTLLVEREDRVGGWCRSVQEAGYTWDYAGHIMFSNDQEVLKLYDTLLGDNLHWQNREAWIYSKNVYTRYPFQGSLYGLPPEVLKECITGAIEARFGSLKANFNAVARAPEPEPQNFEEFIYRVWGKGIAKHFAVPYNQKLWAVPLNEMETSWLGGRVPLPDLEQMIEGALKPTPAPMGPNARFGYPLRGGFQALMNGFLPHLKCEMALNTRVVKVSPANRTVLLDDGRTIQYETLISTMPLPALVQACGDEAPPEVQEAAGGLRHVSVRCVNLGVKRENITDKHWIYYPEDSVFHRIFVQGNASPHCNAPGGFALTAEITYSPSKPLPCDGQALIDRVIADCRRVGLINEDDEVEAANQVDMPCAYVVYDHARAANVNRIREWMSQFGIVLAGRYSEWEYYNSDHAFVAGRKAAEQALEAQRLLREAVARRVNEPSANEEAPKVAAAGGGADEPAPVLKAAAAVRAAEIARLSRTAQATTR